MMHAKIKDAPAFDMYAERWIAGTIGMTDMEELCYFRLLLHSWIADGLPPETPHLCRLARMKSIPAAVLDKFPVWADGKRRNRKLEFERQKQRQRILESGFRQSVNAWKRWHKGKPLPDYLLSIEAYHTHTLGNAMASPPALPWVSPPPTTHPIVILSPARGDGWPELAQVVEEAEKVLAGPDCAEAFFNEMEGGGWVTKHGHAISDWRPLLRNYATRWKANDFQRKSGNGNRQQPQQRPTMQL